MALARGVMAAAGRLLLLAASVSLRVPWLTGLDAVRCVRVALAAAIEPHAGNSVPLVAAARHHRQKLPRRPVSAPARHARPMQRAVHRPLHPAAMAALATAPAPAPASIASELSAISSPGRPRSQYPQVCRMLRGDLHPRPHLHGSGADHARLWRLRAAFGNGRPTGLAQAAGGSSVPGLLF